MRIGVLDRKRGITLKDPKYHKGCGYLGKGERNVVSGDVNRLLGCIFSIGLILHVFSSNDCTNC